MTNHNYYPQERTSASSTQLNIAPAGQTGTGQLQGSLLKGYIPDLPARYVARTDIFGGLHHDVISHRIVGLVGMGGAGKTILATAIARDPAVQATFPNGIVWVDAGPQATPTQLQERLAFQLTRETVSFPAVEMGRHYLADLLADRAFLLIIDDIPDAETLHALNVAGAPRGALLFTTRDRAIARAVGATVREVDQLALEEALTLLSRWTDTDFQRLPPIADRMCLRVGNLALGVALVGGMIKARGAQPGGWQDVMDLLEGADVDAIADAYGPDSYKHASVLASITVSIEDLPPADRGRYRELAVFAGRRNVPPNAVSALWASAGCTAADTDRILTLFVDRSLAQRDSRGWVTLHDLQYEVAAHQLTANSRGLVLAHGQLIDGYRSQFPHAVTVFFAGSEDEPSVWARGPDDGYLFQNLAFHLARAERHQQLDSLLVNFAWLERKLEVAGISETLADYAYQPRTAHVDAVHGALQLSAHVLARDPGMLAGQLVGRLLRQPDPRIRALVEVAQLPNGSTWLCPRTPGSLTQPGGPLERMLQGHTSEVRAVAVTPDGQRIASGGNDGTVRVWNLASGRLERTLEGQNREVRAVAITPDGQRIASGGYGGVQLWNLASGRLERTLERYYHAPVRAVAVTPDGQRIVTGHDATLEVCNLASGRLENIMAGPYRIQNASNHNVRALAVTPDSERIAFSDRGGWVQVRNLASGNLERTLEGQNREVRAMAITPDGQHIISGCDDCTVRVWNMGSGKLERTLEGHNGGIGAVALTPDGHHIISGSDDSTIRVWNLVSGNLGRTPDSRERAIRALTVTRDGQHIISGGDDCTVRVWNMGSGKLERTLEGHTRGVCAVALTPDGHHVISGSDESMTMVWDMASGNLQRTLEGLHLSAPVEAQGPMRGRVVAVTADGRHVISGCQGGIVQVLNMASGKLERTCVMERGGVPAAAITNDCQHIAFSSAGRFGRVQVWNLARGKLERAFKTQGSTAAERRTVRAVAVTPDGQRIVSGGDDGTVRVWNMASGNLEHTLQGHNSRVGAIAVTADGQRIVSGDNDGTMRVWDLAGGTELAYWVTDTVAITSCAGYPLDPATIIYGDMAGRVVVLSLHEPARQRADLPSR